MTGIRAGGLLKRSTIARKMFWAFLPACLLILFAASASGLEPKSGAQPQTPPAGASSPISWLEKIKLSGILNAEGRWMQYASIPGGDFNSVSSLYIRQFSLGIEARLLQGASATVVLNSEWIGDDLNHGDGSIALDEIHFDMDGRMSVVAGKQTQPFGQFESDLVTDPMTQDAYETKQVGVTLGVKGPMDGNFSLTVYKGAVQMDQLFQSGLVDTAKVQRQSMTLRNIGSYIASAQTTPWLNHLTVFGALLTEPGYSKRNTSADAGFNFVPPNLSGLTVNLEGIRALSRETYAGQARQYRESVLTASVSYAFVIKERLLPGRRTYLARRSSRGAHPVVATARYESFDDDGLAAATGTWSVKNRSSIGARYAFRNDGGVLAFVQTEVRQSTLRNSATSHDQDIEIYLRAGTDF